MKLAIPVEATIKGASSYSIELGGDPVGNMTRLKENQKIIDVGKINRGVGHRQE